MISVSIVVQRVLSLDGTWSGRHIANPILREDSQDYLIAGLLLRRMWSSESSRWTELGVDATFRTRSCERTRRTTLIAGLLLRRMWSSESSRWTELGVDATTRSRSCERTRRT